MIHSCNRLHSLVTSTLETRASGVNGSAPSGALHRPARGTALPTRGSHGAPRGQHPGDFYFGSVIFDAHMSGMWLPSEVNVLRKAIGHAPKTAAGVRNRGGPRRSPGLVLHPRLGDRRFG